MSFDFACPDWTARLKAGKTPIPDLPLDKAEADRAAAIFDRLRLPDVPGQPTMAEAAGEWQRDIVRAIFGSMVGPARHVAEAFVLVPKKNSKTTGGAAIMVTALLFNKRPRAEFLLIGPTQDIADLAYQQAWGMIEADEYLRKRFQPVEHRKTIIDRLNKSKLRIKSFDMKVMTGVKPVGVLVDELHVTSSMNGASRVIGQIRGGLLPNPESFLIFITTQSDEPPAGVFRAELQYARGVRDGRIKNSRMLPILYEFSEAMQRSGEWRLPANWPLVLPNLGRSITLDRLQADYAGAVEKGEEEERRWASQHLDVEIGLALHSERWVGADYWESRGDPKLTLDEVLKRSEVVCIGIDGGGLDDLFGLAVLGREKGTRQWLLWSHAWAHESVLVRRKSEAEKLRDFEKAGDLTIIARLGDDVDGVVEIALKVFDAGLLSQVGLDPAGVGAVVDALADVGIEGSQVVGVSQGWRMSGAIKTAERKLADKTLTHSGQSLMAWAVGNAKVEPKGNAITITKQAAGTAKIDPLMAAFDAVALMAMNPEARGPSVYETRGIQELDLMEISV